MKRNETLSKGDDKPRDCLKIHACYSEALGSYDCDCDRCNVLTSRFVISQSARSGSCVFFFFGWIFGASTPEFETYVRGMFVSGRHIDASNVT